MHENAQKMNGCLHWNRIQTWSAFLVMNREFSQSPKRQREYFLFSEARRGSSNNRIDVPVVVSGALRKLANERLAIIARL